MNLVRGKIMVVSAVLLFAEAVVFPRPGSAQQIVQGQFHLSQEVRWENSLLPVGDYVYYVDASHWPALVRVESTGGGFSDVFLPQGRMRPGKQGDRGIALGAFENGSYVMALHLQDLGEELYFSQPGAELKNTSADPSPAPEAGPASARARENLTILNPNHEKISIEEVERVYLRACEAVEKQFNRPAPIRPRLILRLGAAANVLHYPMGEIQLKKWDEYRFAEGVLDLAIHAMVPPEERARLGNAAVHEADTTVNVCELKACVN